MLGDPLLAYIQTELRSRPRQATGSAAVVTAFPGKQAHTLPLEPSGSMEGMHSSGLSESILGWEVRHSLDFCFLFEGFRMGCAACTHLGPWLWLRQC